MLIAIAGIDGAGKTRLARAVARRVSGLYRKQCVGRSFDRALALHGVPDVTQLPSSVGQILSVAYATDFAAYAGRFGARAPSADRHVVLDRWLSCVRSFAAVFALEPCAITHILAKVDRPDVEFLLDLDPAIALSRVRKRGAFDWDERIELLEPLRRAYLSQAGGNTIILDASRAEDEVRDSAIAHLARSNCGSRSDSSSD